MAAQWEPEGTWRRFRPGLLMAFLDIEIAKPEAAKPQLEQIIGYEDGTDDEEIAEVDQTGFVRQAYGEVLLREGRVVEASAR